jgi:D-alanine-D-alanine ligase
MSTKLKVAVVMGGNSAERDISLLTGRQILDALDPAKYEAVGYDAVFGARPALSASRASLSAETRALVEKAEAVVSERSLAQIAQPVGGGRPDVVFIALHGPGGEDGTVQGLLEVLGLPYTGSGVLASALAMDKAMAKRVLMPVGVRMPQDIVARRGEQNPESPEDMALPWIVKPSRQGSTFGVTVVDDRKQLPEALAFAFQYDDTALVEQFVKGTEITVPIIGNDDLEVLPIVEIVPAGGFYDYAAKYTPGATDEIVPARISTETAAEARRIAELCHRTLGCRGMSRTDMIVTASNEIYVLETNTIPGMTPTSLLPRAAEAAGISFPNLLDRLIALALEKRK